MKLFTTTEAMVLNSIICDSCGLRAELNDGEFNEFMVIERITGYNSVFGDGSHIRMDLCQHCTKSLLGQYIQYPANWKKRFYQND